MKQIESIILDPNGYVILSFRDFDSRADFLRNIPSGNPYAMMRPSDDGKRLAWKLDELTAITTLQEPNARTER